MTNTQRQEVIAKTLRYGNVTMPGKVRLNSTDKRLFKELGIKVTNEGLGTWFAKTKKGEKTDEKNS